MYPFNFKTLLTKLRVSNNTYTHIRTGYLGIKKVSYLDDISYHQVLNFATVIILVYSEFNKTLKFLILTSSLSQTERALSVFIHT